MNSRGREDRARRFTIKGRQADGALATFGINLYNPNLVTSLLNDLNSLSSYYTAGFVNNDEGSFLEYLARDFSFLSSSTILDKAIDGGANRISVFFAGNHFSPAWERQE